MWKKQSLCRRSEHCWAQVPFFRPTSEEWCSVLTWKKQSLCRRSEHYLVQAPFFRPTSKERCLFFWGARSSGKCLVLDEKARLRGKRERYNCAFWKFSGSGQSPRGLPGRGVAPAEKAGASPDPHLFKKPQKRFGHAGELLQCRAGFFCAACGGAQTARTLARRQKISKRPKSEKTGSKKVNFQKLRDFKKVDSKKCEPQNSGAKL